MLPSHLPGGELISRSGPTLFINPRGVLHPRWAGDFNPPEGVPAPPRFCWSEPLRPVAERWNLRLVLRTSDMFNMPFESVKSLAPPWLASRIVDRTADVWRYIGWDEPRKVDSAYNVTRKYVEAHEIQHWVALDHADDGWPHKDEVRKHLVCCNVELGLTEVPALASLEKALIACRP